MSLPFAHLAIPDAAALRAAIPTVSAALRLPADRLDRPWAPGKAWTVAQMAWHLADAESVMLDRVRRILTIDEPELPSIPQNIWSVQLPPRPIASAAPLFVACRSVIADLVQHLAPTALERRGIHPEYGAMRLSDILKHLHGHALHHAGQLAPWAT